MRNVCIAITALGLGLAANLFAQTGNAQLGGIVQDPSKALIPGVSVTATNVETNIAATQVTNESGAYNFPVLQPGTYRVTAELPGFRKAINNDVRLPYAGQTRIDFTLELGQMTQSVEVSVAFDSLLRESSASVSDVLTQERIEALPLVGNDVLSLLSTLPGLRINPTSENLNTINGLGLNSVNVTRDGLSTVDVRAPSETFGLRTMSTTQILPDLVGEIRMVVSPVDAELGRGNSQVQIRSRSGTNKYSGSVSWNVRNTALDGNTWTNNHTAFTDPISNVLYNRTPKDWNNNHQYTIAYGGPVRIPGVYDGRNKTFFYGVWVQNIAARRQTFSVPVLTDTARLGIFRYWQGYNPLGWNPSATLAAPVFPQVATTASYISVDQRGNSVKPPADPLSPTSNPTQAGFIPYTGSLVCFSVFGSKRLDANANMVDFTNADCPGGSASLPKAANGLWDSFRPVLDSSGQIKKFLQTMPKPNYFGAGDGLNIAQLRWIRSRYGDNGTNSIFGASDNVSRKQININIDHNFNVKHKVAVHYTAQRDHSEDNCGTYPDGICGEQYRTPHTVTVNLTSTLSSRMVNEGRFGDSFAYNFAYSPWESPNTDLRDKARQFLLPAGTSIKNPDYTYLALVGSVAGNIGSAQGYMTSAPGNTIVNINHLYNWADTLSWTTGKHAFKFGVDWRLPRTNANAGLQPYPTVTLGNASAATASPFGVTANFNTASDAVGYLPGLLNAAPTGATAGRTNVSNLLYYLSGSVSAVSQPYWVTGSKNQTENYWDDLSTVGMRLRKQIIQEWAIFAKDDYKITRRLTLNLGARWEYYSSPYYTGGFTTALLGWGNGAFGATRAAQTTLDKFNKDPFSILYHPGKLYLTGYGSSTTNPLSCQVGAQQNALLPVSTCDPNALSSITFVGPKTAHPEIVAMPQQFYNIGPAIGFAYNVPWFGEGKTTIRGGYQQTFGTAGVTRGVGGFESAAGSAPGVSTVGTLANNINNTVYQNIINSGRAITLSDIKSLVPQAPNQTTPGSPVPIYGRSFSPTVYDANLKTSYTQNLTLSVTRQINRKLTLDLRYTGTLGRKQTGSFDINLPNVYHNPEFYQALADARAATCTPNSPAYKSYTDKGINPCDTSGDPILLDQLLAGLNINNTVSGFGAVGTVVNGVLQTGAQQLRRNATFQNNLSLGDFNAISSSLIALAPTPAQGRQNIPINPSTGGTLAGVAMTAMRNGCDRIANGFTVVQQTAAGGTQVANSGAAIPLRCFAEDYLIANPQFGSITYLTNPGRTNYHALQGQLTARPTSGITTQATWVWAKSFYLPGTGYIDPANRDINYQVQNINTHSLRANGTVELPIGPNKLLFPNASGWVARAIERWQTSFILNVASGTPVTINAPTSHFYAASGYNVASPNWVLPQAHGVVWDAATSTGTMYRDNPYVAVVDPQCRDASIVGLADKMGTNLQSVCTLSALAKRNPDGTAGEVLLKYPLPGQVGNLGRGNIKNFGQWFLDMNASKSFRVGESRSFQIRVDATNVLNHPVPNLPGLTAESLGTVTGKGDQTRAFQGQLRINF